MTPATPEERTFSWSGSGFATEGVVAAEIIEITPSKAAPELEFLLPK